MTISTCFCSFRAVRTSLSALMAVIVIAITLPGCSTPENKPKPEEPASKPAEASAGTIVRLDPALDALVPPDARIEKVASGFGFIEGPLWRPDGVLWFSDVTGNVVRQWSPDGTTKDVLRPGGYDGNALPEGGYNGPNGMVADKDGSVLICQHGNRRIVKMTKDMKVSTLVDRYEGKKLNSPNDLVFHSDGSLYFTDPPYGLPKADDDPSKELQVNGVYRLANGKLKLIIKDLTRPNGIAFSPDYKILYVANSDDKRKVWMRYDVAADGTVKNGSVFADVTSEKEAGVPDGMKVDSLGNVYATGPGGVWVFSPEGKHLGTIKLPETPANLAWGDDGKTLYLTAQTGLYRVKLAIPGEKAVYP